MKRYQAKHQTWLLLGVVSAIAFGVLQDILPGHLPGFFNPGYWRDLWLTSVNQVQMPTMFGLLLLSLLTTAGGTSVCVFLRRRTVPPPTAHNAQKEVTNSGPY